MIGIADRIELVKTRIDEALRRAGRRPGSVTLVAVSKTFPAEAIAAAFRSGLMVFGENKVQEASSKSPGVTSLIGGAAISWHLVGHLQSNKAKTAVALFELIHSVDGLDLATKLDRAAGAIGKRQPVLVQVNVAGEDTKSGVAPEALRPLVEHAVSLENLDIRGLMTIPPYDPDPERSRRHFAALRGLGEKVRGWLGDAAMGKSPARGPGTRADRDPGTAVTSYPGELSMGMSEDFEVAIEEGATMVRVGRAIFGERSTV